MVRVPIVISLSGKNADLRRRRRLEHGSKRIPIAIVRRRLCRREQRPASRQPWPRHEKISPVAQTIVDEICTAGSAQLPHLSGVARRRPTRRPEGDRPAIELDDAPPEAVPCPDEFKAVRPEMRPRVAVERRKQRVGKQLPLL